MTEKQFEDFLQVCHKEINEKQKVLNDRYYLKAYTRYNFNQKEEMIQFTNQLEDRLVFEITCIGSWAPKDKNWIWAWANDSFSESIRAKANELKELERLTGHEVFTREGFECEGEVARDLAYMGVHQLDAIGIYRIEAEDSYVFLALNKIK